MSDPRVRSRPCVGGPRVVTAANALTLSRILAVPVVMWALAVGANVLGAALFLAAAATDFFDGRLARRRGCESALGASLDPLADRLMLSGVAVVLAARGLLPVLPVAVLVGRDALAVAGGYLVALGTIRVSRVGKYATAVLMAGTALILFGLDAPGTALFYAGLALSLWAGLRYALSAVGSGKSGS